MSFTDWVIPWVAEGFFSLMWLDASVSAVGLAEDRT